MDTCIRLTSPTCLHKKRLFGKDTYFEFDSLGQSLLVSLSQLKHTVDASLLLVSKNLCFFFSYMIELLSIFSELFKRFRLQLCVCQKRGEHLQSQYWNLLTTQPYHKKTFMIKQYLSEMFILYTIATLVPKRLSHPANHPPTNHWGARFQFRPEHKRITMSKPQNYFGFQKN